MRMFYKHYRKIVLSQLRQNVSDIQRMFPASCWVMQLNYISVTNDNNDINTFI